MGQKVHPIGFRLGYIRDHDASWFADRNYREYCLEDMRIRAYLDRYNKLNPVTIARDEEERRFEQGLAQASISRVLIGRVAGSVNLTIFTAKPGAIIGRGGRGIELLQTLLQRMTRKHVVIEVIEERDPDLNARLVAEKIANQLSRRISFRRAVRQAAQATMRANSLGVKIIVAGRLGGADMARRHVHKEGSVPLQTLRADIDYGTCEAMTAYGNIGVKVWVYRGEKLPEREETQAPQTMNVRRGEAPRPAPSEAPRGRRGRRRAPRAESDSAPRTQPSPEAGSAPADGGEA